MNTAPIIARLQAQCNGFKYTGGVLDLTEPTLLAPNYPGAFVIPLGESADPNILAGSHLQRLHQQWGILLAIKSMRTSATDQSAELQTLRVQVRSALMGWAPDTASDPLEFSSGSLVSLEAGVLLWQDEYTTTQYLQGA